VAHNGRVLMSPNGSGVFDPAGAFQTNSTNYSQTRANQSFAAIFGNSS